MAGWKEDVIQALKNLGGVARRAEIHKEVARLRKGKLNNTYEQTIQEILQRHSSDSIYGRGKVYGKGNVEDIFEMVEGKGKGVWGLRNYKSRIRDMFIRILKEYKFATKEKLTGHPFAKYLRDEVPKIINESAKNILSGYKVNTVKHVGRWSKRAWINFMDPRITTTAKNGYYPAYLFHDDGSKILFELGQGTENLRKTYKKEAESILLSRAIILRNKVKEFSKYGFRPITKKMSIGLSQKAMDWRKSGAFGKIYNANKLPEESEILRDLANMLKLYKLAIERGGVSEGTNKTRTEYDQEYESLSGDEKVKLQKHKEDERKVLQVNTKLINDLKENYKYTCQACGLTLKDIYGDYFGEKKEFIEAHHIIPKSETLKNLKDNEKLKRTKEDFAILCANCHRIIHRYNTKLKKFLTLEEFKSKINKGGVNNG